MARVAALAILAVVRYLPAADLGQPPGPPDAAWAVLDKSLRSGDIEHRRQAIAAMGTIDPANQEAVTRLLHSLKDDKDARGRMQAALALGQMKAAQAIPDLKAALDDTGEVAFAAAKALTNLHDPSGKEMLVAVLAGERKDTPGIFTNALREADHRLRHPKDMILMGAEDGIGAMCGPAAMGVMALENTNGLRGKPAPSRAAAAAYLAKEDDDPYAVGMLEWALGDKSELVRMEAAKALGSRGNLRTVGELTPLLRDRHNGVRTMAAASIIRLSSHESVVPQAPLAAGRSLMVTDPSARP